MPRLVNRSQRVIVVGGVQLNPGTPAEVADSEMENPRVKELLESKDIEVAGQEQDQQKSKPNPQQKPQPQPSQQQPNPQQTNPPTMKPQNPTPPKESSHKE